MIRRNTAGQVIYFPQLVLAADGTAVTASATLTIAKDGTEAESAGTLAHSSNGVWKYTPTQAETDAAIVALILTATDAVPVVLNLVTTGADTSAVAFGASTATPLDAAGIRDAVGLGSANLDSQLIAIDNTADAILADTDTIPAWPTNFSLLAINGDGEITTSNPATEGGEIIVNPTELSSGSVDAIRDGLATATELDKVVKSGEERTISRDGQDSITFTETRV